MLSRYPFLPALVWATIIFILSAMPGRFFPSFSFWELLTADKIVHSIMYGILTWLLWWACFRTSTWHFRPLTTIFGAAMLSTAYGASLEWMQEHFFIGRLYEVLDMVANAIGAVIAATAGIVFRAGKREI